MEEEMFEEGEEFEYIAKKDKRYIILVIYDIVDNKKRTAMVHCLNKYGMRVQKSAFEAYLTDKKYNQLVEESKKIIDIETDSLRIYVLADHTSVRSWGVGDIHEEDVIIF